MFTLLIRAWGSTAASINTYLQPIVGVLLGVVVLREAITTSGWLALGIILTGIAVFGFGSVIGSLIRIRISRDDVRGGGRARLTCRPESRK